MAPATIDFAAQRESYLRALFLSLYAIVVGVLAGLAAVLFRLLIGLLQNAFFNGVLSFDHAEVAEIHTNLGPWVILVPVLAVSLARFITQLLAPEATRHGVPEIMAAVVEDGGKIRPVAGIAKALSAAITIGGGGSVGRVGPVVHIGAGFGSAVGTFFRLSPRERIILVGSGAAASIGATFNAPIAGVFFATELILPEFSIMTIMPLVIASTVATHTASLFFGSGPAFSIPPYSPASSGELLLYVLLGIIAAGAAIAHIAGLYAVQDRFERPLLKSGGLDSWLKTLFGSALVGVIGYLFQASTGRFFVFGVGYPFINSLLLGVSFSVPLLLLVAVAKIVANGLTLAAGGSGGVFAPSLFIGAAIGATVGLLAGEFFPGSTGSVASYAAVGMAAVVAGTTGATITAITMTFEITRDYDIMLPLMLAVVVSHFLCRAVYKDTIYTKKLTRRGIPIHHDKRISLFKITSVRETMKTTDMVTAQRDDPAREIRLRMLDRGVGVVPVLDEKRVVGTVAYTDIHDAPDSVSIDRYVHYRDIMIPADADAMAAFERMQKRGTDVLMVEENETVVGYVTKNLLLKKYFEKRDMLL